MPEVRSAGGKRRNFKWLRTRWAEVPALLLGQ